MVRIDSLIKIDDCLASYRAILFVHFDWSHQSHQSLKVFEKLPAAIGKRFPRIVPVYYRVDPDLFTPDRELDVIGRFMFRPTPGAAELSGGGFGPVAWMTRGKVIAYERFAAKAGLEALLSKTETTIEDPALRRSD